MNIGLPPAATVHLAQLQMNIDELEPGRSFHVYTGNFEVDGNTESVRCEGAYPHFINAIHTLIQGCVKRGVCVLDISPHKGRESDPELYSTTRRTEYRYVLRKPMTA